MAAQLAIETKLGQTFQIEAVVNYTSGESQQIFYNPEFLTLENEEFEPSASSAGGVDVYTFSSHKAGRTGVFVAPVPQGRSGDLHPEVTQIVILEPVRTSVRRTSARPTPSVRPTSPTRPAAAPAAPSVHPTSPSRPAAPAARPVSPSRPAAPAVRPVSPSRPDPTRFEMGSLRAPKPPRSPCTGVILRETKGIFRSTVAIEGCKGDDELDKFIFDLTNAATDGVAYKEYYLKRIIPAGKKIQLINYLNSRGLKYEIKP